MQWIPMVSNGTYGCFRDDSKPDLRQSVAVCCRPASAIRPPSPGPVIRPAMQVRGPSWGCVKMCEGRFFLYIFFGNCYIADIADIADDLRCVFSNNSFGDIWRHFGQGEQNRPCQGNASTEAIATSQGSRVPSSLDNDM